MATRDKPCIAVTPGEPAGIGPDICIQLSQQPVNAKLVLFCDPVLLQNRARQLGVRMFFEVLDHKKFASNSPKLAPITVVPVKTRISVSPGQPNTFNADYVLQTLKLATQSCMDGLCQALVTGPVHKAIINDAGIPFSGHTEYLAQMTNTTLPVMMLQTGNFRVALATTHIPLSQVSETITAQRLRQVIDILHNDLVKRYRIRQPKIIVAGLNPHAGEGGHLGDEEQKVITPVIKQCQSSGMNIEGPMSADTMFVEYLDKADSFLAMYHDQGLPVLKYKGFHQAVNVTLGLPIVRTSVDHGTALSLAGSGKSDCGSLQAAIETAISLSSH